MWGTGRAVNVSLCFVPSPRGSSLHVTLIKFSGERTSWETDPIIKVCGCKCVPLLWTDPEFTDPANIWHNFCFEFCCSFQPVWREIPQCVFCQLVCLPSVRHSPGKDQTLIYKSRLWWTVRVEACPAIPPSVSKSFASLFDVPVPQCCWVRCPQLFFAFIPCQSSWHQSRVCINQCSPDCMKWFCHSRRTLSPPNTQLQHRLLMWIFWRFEYKERRQSSFPAL